MSATSTHEEIKVGGLAVRFVIEGEQSGGSLAAFEFDVPDLDARRDRDRRRCR